MTDMPVIDEAIALFAGPPAEFVGERNRLVKLLKSAGRADDATFVAGLKRPKLSEYALNRLTHEHGPISERLIEAIEGAAAAQAAAIGGEPGGLREATAELRAATKLAVDSAVQLLDGDGASGEGQRDEITNLIREMVATGDTEALRYGVVGAIAADGDSDKFRGLFRGAPDPPAGSGGRAKAPNKPSTTSAAPPTKVPTKATKKSSLAPPRVGPSPAERARRIALERQLRDAQAMVERGERSVAEAEDQLRTAQAKYDERSSVLAARRTAVTEAERALDSFRLNEPA